MRKSRPFAFVTTLMILFLSCKKEHNGGVPTMLKGHVTDTIRRINIPGYKVVLLKKWSSCANWNCATSTEEVATAYTDANGNYTFTFNYKLAPGESYIFAEQNYGSPWYTDQYISSGPLVAGKTNTLDIVAWKPIELTLDVTVVNNSHAPLIIGAKIANGDRLVFNTGSFIETNARKTITVRTKPNTDIYIAFWYCRDRNSCTDVREKRIPFRTTLDEVTPLSYTIDCSTF